MMEVGLFIGRFQPFHNGHLWAVKHILKEVDKLVIAIGSSQASATPTDPFSASERKDMIDTCMKALCISNYAIFLVPDIREDCQWVEHIRNIIPHFNTVYTGSQISAQLFAEKGYAVKNLPRHRGISASEVRLRIAKGLPWKPLVPSPVRECLLIMGGPERIRNLNSTRSSHSKKKLSGSSQGLAEL